MEKYLKPKRSLSYQVQTEVNNSDFVVNIKWTTLTNKNIHGEQNLAKSGSMTLGRKSREALFDAELQNCRYMYVTILDTLS